KPVLHAAARWLPMRGWRRAASLRLAWLPLTCLPLAWLALGCSDEFQLASGGSAGAAGGGAAGAAGSSGAAGGGSGGVGGSAGSGATGGSAGSAAAGGSGGTGGDASACDPTALPADDACVVDEEYAVFVSPSGDDNAAGSRAAPLGSVGKGVTAA